MDKSSKELAIELLAGYIAGISSTDSFDLDNEKLKQKYEQYLELVKSLPN